MKKSKKEIIKKLKRVRCGDLASTVHSRREAISYCKEYDAFEYPWQGYIAPAGWVWYKKLNDKFAVLRHAAGTLADIHHHELYGRH